MIRFSQGITAYSADISSKRERIIQVASTGNVLGDIVAGGILLLFGLMVFFIARIRKTSLTVSKTKKVESVLGIFLGITAPIFGITIAIFGGVTNTSANGN